MSLSTVLAKALFDNAAESPEELAFRKGDILMVLDQEQEGGPGWWLCSLHGRQGIAPANRLRLLQTNQTPTSSAGTETRRAPSVDSVHASPSQQSCINGLSIEDSDGVYLSPPSLAEGVYQSPGTAPAAVRSGELRHSDGGRPRSHSSSGSRPRPDWGDMSVAGRPRSPSLKGRGGESGTVYQTPTSPAPHRSQDALASDSVYLTPSAVPRSAAETTGEARYFTSIDAGAGHSDGCYLVPRPAVTALTNDNLYQTPSSGVPVAGQCVPGMTSRLTDGITPKSTSSQCKSSQDAPGMYQTPTPPGGAISRTPQAERKHPSGTVGVSAVSTPGQNLKKTPPPARGSLKPQGTSSTPSVSRGKLPQAGVRESPLLARTGISGVPGSPNFRRKPPPPAPPVRSVTRKDLTPSSPIPATKTVLQAKPAPPQTSILEDERQGRKNGHTQVDEMKKNSDTVTKKECANSHDEKLSDEVYDTPPTNRWQHPVPAVPSEEEEEEDDGIYNTPRAIPLHTEQSSEIYDVPTLALNSSSDHQQQTYNIPGSPAVGGDAEDEDVYSVPSLPGLPLEASEMPGLPAETAGNGRAYSISSPRKQNSVFEDVSEPDGSIYNMPALTLEIPSRRLSVSSTGSADIQWKASLSALVQSALTSASLPTTSSRELAAALAEILSVWKTGHVCDVPPVLQQAWSRLSDLLPALSVCGTAPPANGLLSMVSCALEDSALLLQSQTRPRLPSQESLSRRPLPALPVAEVKPIAGDMGSRKGSWIQERPLPPPPPAAFPLPPTQVFLAPSIGRVQDEEQGNEYAGIGLTPTPAPSYPVGDSVGYVKLQGKPEPPPDTQTEHSSLPLITATDNKLSPSPAVPVSQSLEDSELLSFYSSQSLSHLSCLANAIDSLFTSVQVSQPPRVFVSRGKSLIVTAHKLVFIGDTLARLLSSSDLRAKVTTSSGRLCQALKAVVVATKGAAQNYPSVPATQEMVDRVADLSQHAAGFSGLLQRLAEIS